MKHWELEDTLGLTSRGVKEIEDNSLSWSDIMRGVNELEENRSRGTRPREV